MEFRELSTFLQVAKLQSFSKAAKVLGYSQAAVTIQIKTVKSRNWGLISLTGSANRPP